MRKYTTIFLGSKPGAALVLKKMITMGWSVKCVVISDKSSHDWLPSPTLSQIAKEEGIPVLNHQATLHKFGKVDLVISYMYRELVKKKVCDQAEVAAINFHPAPLPRFGGWAFYNVAILENSKEYGCTCHYMDDNFDTGALLKVNKFPIDAKFETAVSLERKTQHEMLNLFDDFCSLLYSNSPLPYSPQDKSKMRYMNYDEFSELKKIPENPSSEVIDLFARAFWYPPYECAYINLGDSKIEIMPEIAKQEVAQCIHASDYLRMCRNIDE